eukprot:CAMPEP_0197523362 /NCGR_PEP_ID=MMETSP1318-20131121/8311_1 /TAXON_ID=552666 /ORGANISM="Partenskyella glossopodia, Strain RCC365" /LENGTH=520 /DNA_ID=CAMNT_0043076033 /DNA_START=155 /DNA_END=1717 /DNA_ORIENTATION=+
MSSWEILKKTLRQRDTRKDFETMREFRAHQVVQRYITRGEDCPWDKIKSWAEMSKREARQRHDVIFFNQRRSGPGWGVTLAFEAAAMLLAIVYDRPMLIAIFDSDSMVEAPPFNAYGSLLASPLFTSPAGWTDSDQIGGPGEGLLGHPPDSFYQSFKLGSITIDESEDVGVFYEASRYNPNKPSDHEVEAHVAVFGKSCEEWMFCQKVDDEMAQRLMLSDEIARDVRRNGVIRMNEILFNVDDNLLNDPWWDAHNYNGTYSFETKMPRNFSLIPAGTEISNALFSVADFLRADPDERIRDLVLQLGARPSEFSAPKCVLRATAGIPTAPVARLLLDELLENVAAGSWILAVHIRMGDFVMANECPEGGDCAPEIQKGDELERHNADMVLETLKELKKNVIPKIVEMTGIEVTVFLASDTTRMVTRAKEVFPNLLTFSGQTKHNAVGVEFEDDVRTAADFMAMALADFCVRCSSSFSGMAFEMGGCQDTGEDSMSGLHSLSFTDQQMKAAMETRKLTTSKF